MRRLLTATLLLACAAPAMGDDASRFQLADVFELEHVADPQISPDGKRVVYLRRSMDKMTDKQVSDLWIINADGTDHRPLTDTAAQEASPRWSPDGERLAYVSADADGAQIHVRWMDTGASTAITQLTAAPGALAWSPDGERIAFSMLVKRQPEPLAKLPSKPEGAEWAESAQVIDTVEYRADGAGFIKPGFHHLFVVPASGGTARQLTRGDYHHESTPSWMPDGETLIVSANRNDDWALDPLESDLYRLDVASGEMSRLTERDGPDHSPQVAPDGETIAYLGFTDRKLGYQANGLWLMERKRDGTTGQPRQLLADFDHGITNPRWDARSRGLFFQYDVRGETRLGYVSTRGKLTRLAGSMGGQALGRPYTSGQFSVADDGTYALTVGSPQRPADLAVGRRGGHTRITALNADALGHKTLGAVEAITFDSSADGREIQGWLVTPPDFDPEQTYPLIIEIHGGPFAAYGPHFAAEVQLFAEAGYVVLYVNPRGSTSYGSEFANLIHHNYPGQDYDDLMSGVDAVLARGFVDPERLFITGGSGGGVLTAWSIGKTDRFAAAVVAKPVINWYSFVLTADVASYFYQYWFANPPWEDPDAYLRRSPISLVGNVTTPTMLLTGERDYRTPIAESEQFYQALKLRGVDATMVRIPEAAHSIAARPSQLMSKVAHILAWFEQYDPAKQDDADS